MELFVDTWGWIALSNKREMRHEQVKRFYGDFQRRQGSALTTDYVLDETFTLLFRRMPFAIATDAMNGIEKALEQGYLKLERITPERFEKAKGLRLRFRDKPRISFTDLTSMVVMEELRVNQVLTGDAHFARVGMGFTVIP